MKLQERLIAEHHRFMLGGDARVKAQQDRTEAKCICAVCGCGGNNDCGHMCLAQDCTINSDNDVCPCCFQVVMLSDETRTAMVDKYEREVMGQEVMAL